MVKPSNFTVSDKHCSVTAVLEMSVGKEVDIPKLQQAIITALPAIECGWSIGAGKLGIEHGVGCAGSISVPVTFFATRKMSYSVTAEQGPDYAGLLQALAESLREQLDVWGGHVFVGQNELRVLDIPARKLENPSASTEPAPAASAAAAGGTPDSDGFGCPS